MATCQHNNMDTQPRPIMAAPSHPNPNRATRHHIQATLNGLPAGIYRSHDLHSHHITICLAAGVRPYPAAHLGRQLRAAGLQPTRTSRGNAWILYAN